MSALALPDKLEKEWDADLFGSRKGLARLLGWSSYHTLRSRGSAPGFPDRVLWKERTIFAELKRELTGRESVDGLTIGGCEVYLWRPSDLEEIARILGKPWGFMRFVGGRHKIEVPPHLATIHDGYWTPRSIWIPGAGRADDAEIT
jgi:hypothetical protein